MWYRWIHSSIVKLHGLGERQDRCLNYMLACYKHFHSYSVRKCWEEESSSWTKQKLSAKRCFHLCLHLSAQPGWWKLEQYNVEQSQVFFVFCVFIGCTRILQKASISLVGIPTKNGGKTQVCQKVAASHQAFLFISQVRSEGPELWSSY